MDSWLSEDREGPLSFETPLPQSYFKQSSWSRQVHQGIHKQSRVYGCPELEREGPPLLRAHSAFDWSSLSATLSTEVRDRAPAAPVDVLKSNGLVRSQSYPLEEFGNATGSPSLQSRRTALSSTTGDLCTESKSSPLERFRSAAGISSLNFTKASSSLSEGGHCTQSICTKNEFFGFSKVASLDPQTSEARVVSCQQMVVQASGNQQQEKIEVITTEVKAVQPVLGVSPLGDTTSERVTESSSRLIKEPGKSAQLAGLSAGLNVSCTASMHFRQAELGTLSSAGDTTSPPPRCLAARHCPPGSKFLICGRRKEMEDTASVVPSFAVLPRSLMGTSCCGIDPAHSVASDLHFFGIYDGHGGSQASMYCKERLHFLLAEELSMLDGAGNSHNDGDDEHHRAWSSKWERTMINCFSKIDKEVGGVCPNGVCDNEAVDDTCTSCEDAIAPENVGTTAVVAVVGPCQIVIANCGDSRAVLSRGGQAVALSTDHKPERKDETSRIECAGGKIILWDGYRVGGFLALSRAIGDRILKRYVISEPEVTCVQRSSDDEVLILASDGLWDKLSNDVACRVARKAMLTARKKRENRTFLPGEDPAATAVAALLVKLAFDKGSKDNISVVVVDLQS